MTDTVQQIAVIYYTQTGQLRHLAEQVISSFPPNYKVDFLNIESKRKFAFPWNSLSFFDAMPECVLEEGGEVTLHGYDGNKKYDLVILAFQPWFLSPSLPVTGFMQSDLAHVLLNGSKVVTLIGARNMWLNAQEKIKKHLIRLNAQLVGNIAFVDSSPNLVSTLTVIRWAFKGQKEASRFLPEAGVQQAEINRAPEFGKAIVKAIETGNWTDLQSDLIEAGAVEIKPGLILLEETGTKQFKIWAKKIKSKGEPGSPERKPLVTLFKNMLITGIFILSPIKGIVSKIQAFANRNRLKRDLKYFQSVQYRDNKF